MNGTKGDRGIPGIKGDKGIIGRKGPPGIVGAKGNNGSKGEKGNIGPRGDDGMPGRDGIDGRIGRPGLNVSIDEQLTNTLIIVRAACYHVYRVFQEHLHLGERRGKKGNLEKKEGLLVMQLHRSSFF